ncbi:MAG: TetR/AcrR family transcriptional regulator [Sphingomonadales bacterium]
MVKKGESTREKILSVAEGLILARGFSGTSLNDIVAESGLTKGAFFHHFSSKNDLAAAVVERYTKKDLDRFEDFSKQAERLADDPLQEVMIFLKLFEEFLKNLNAPPAGCVFATYTYEKQLFNMGIQELVVDGFRAWSKYYEDKFKKLLKARKPKTPVSAMDLAEMIMAIVEGGFVISRSYGDKTLTIRLSKQFRNYLKLLFETA